MLLGPTELLIVLLLVLLHIPWMLAVRSVLRTPPEAFQTGSKKLWGWVLALSPVAGGCALGGNVGAIVYFVVGKPRN